MKKRLAAEWEPAVGVMVSYPISLPHALVQKFAKDTTLYLLCENQDAVADAKELLSKWDVDIDGVRFILVPKGDDSTWPRDWGPHPLFDERGNFSLLGPRYAFSTPFCGTEENPDLFCAPWGNTHVPLSDFEGNMGDDDTARAIARQTGTSFIKAPFAFTGGNVLNDGINTILSTKVLVYENEFEGLKEGDYLDLVAKLTGMTNYTLLSDYESFSLNHVDCFLKILDDRRLLVERPPRDHELYPVYEHIVNDEIAKARNSHGEPWEVLRIDAGETVNGDGIAAYVNSLILNKCVYVPMYGIDTDESALETWRAAMPGYDIQGFTFFLDDEKDAFNPDELYVNVGWAPGDVLHCRTRAVWDAQMLYVLAHAPREVSADRDVQVDATIVPYSGMPVVDGGCRLFWRVAGKESWNEVALDAGPTLETYVATIPAQAPGADVQAYVTAADQSGRRESYPRTAPDQYLTISFR